MIDAVGPALEPFKAAGLRQAMYLVPVLNLILTFCMCAAARSVPRDIEKLRTWMRDVAAHTPAATEETATQDRMEPETRASWRPPLDGRLSPRDVKPIQKCRVLY